MRILIVTILSLALSTGVFAQSDSRPSSSESKDEPAAERTIDTPFGKAKVTQAPPRKAPPKKSDKLRPDLKVERDGKDFKFSRPTPFGPGTWTRSESQLSADERAVVIDRGLLPPDEEPVEEAEAPAKPVQP